MHSLKPIIETLATDQLAQVKPAPLPLLTESQRRALDHLQALAAIYFSQSVEPQPVRLRLNPLLIGPSGVGKSFLIEHLGRMLAIPVVRTTVGDWIVAGARLNPCSLQSLQQKLEDHPRLILHIDELDKFRSNDQWSLAQRAEIFSVLDRNVGFVGSATSPWERRHSDQLQHSVFIVGSGTWQDLWSHQFVRSMGFCPAVNRQVDILEKVRQAEIIPPELLNRFTDRWLVLEPYGAEDFRLIAQKFGLMEDGFDPVVAAASGRNFRYLESFLTDRALNRQLARNASEGSVIP